MKGKNVIHFCEAQMVEAVEVYLKEHFIKEKQFRVKSVKVKDGINFDIIVEGDVQGSSFCQ